MIRLSCVILNYNDWEHTSTLIKHIENYRIFSNIVVVDNCSTDDSLIRLKELQNSKIVIVQSEKNKGYGYGNNFGMKYAFKKLGADAVLICNPDVSFGENVVEHLSSAMEAQPNCGVISAVQYDRNGNEIDQSAWSIPHVWNYIFSVGKLSSHIAVNFYQNAEVLHRAPVTKVDCVAGSLLLVSRDSFEKTGGYDENVFLYCEETILGCKMKKAGFNTYICSDIHYLHLHGVSISKSVTSAVKRKKLLLKSHHYTLKNYLNANYFALLLDNVVGKIAIAEEYAKAVVAQIR